eukprot:sb/3476807/
MKMGSKKEKKEGCSVVIQRSRVFTHPDRETSKQPIRARYLGHVTGYQPIRDQYFLIGSVQCLIIVPCWRRLTPWHNFKSTLQTRFCFVAIANFIPKRSWVRYQIEINNQSELVI